jgi:small subunit ribosomal protein S17
MNKNKKIFEGVVIGNKMNKTVVVQISHLVKHPVVKKYITVKKKYKAHDEKNECMVGDKVLIRESRPISKEKSWVVSKVLVSQAS